MWVLKIRGVESAQFFFVLIHHPPDSILSPMISVLHAPNVSHLVSMVAVTLHLATEAALLVRPLLWVQAAPLGSGLLPGTQEAEIVVP